MSDEQNDDYLEDKTRIGHNFVPGINKDFYYNTGEGKIGKLKITQTNSQNPLKLNKNEEYDQKSKILGKKSIPLTYPIPDQPRIHSLLLDYKNRIILRLQDIRNRLYLYKNNSFRQILQLDLTHLKLSKNRQILFYLKHNSEIHLFSLKTFRILKIIKRCFWSYKLELLKILNYEPYSSYSTAFGRRVTSCEDSVICVSRELLFIRNFFKGKSGHEEVFHSAKSRLLIIRRK